MIHEREDSIESEVKPAKCTDQFEMSSLGRRLMDIRKKFIAEGGQLLTPEELEREIAERRGGLYAREHQENDVR